MRSSFVTALLALGAVSLAAPRPDSNLPAPLDDAKCMTREEADFLIDVYAKVIEQFDRDLLKKYLSDDFFDTSDSINTFIHKPLGGPTFATKAIFIEKQEVGAHFPIEILSVDAVTCDTVALQWKSTFGAANLPSKGITIMKMGFEDAIWKIRSIEVEFNALTWLLNMGGSYTWEDVTYTPENIDPALVAKPSTTTPTRTT
ncbi:hypothetical protein QBC34DRAFT_363918 [Podospora aff. communis PSN243]|uniref:NTF2-like domain-containing protein n=1 Tax=Podospora aff. communis PSN243 TaxID=3040156 RepID=A0AAV9G582_9PEZI|nr:hypothetical protein QBC34DRAFT_363918 [Podospora aff. communis PSN243]